MDLCSQKMRRKCRLWNECCDRYPRDSEQDLPPCVYKAEETALSAAFNIDYTAALEVELMRLKQNFDIDINYPHIYEVATRLNSVVKAQQNCTNRPPTTGGFNEEN